MNYIVFLYRAVDNEEDEKQKLFEFIDVPSFCYLRTTNVFSPMYLVKNYLAEVC